MSDTESVLLTQDQEAVRVLTLNRPKARNCLSMDLMTSLRSAVADADDNESVRAVVLTGYGNIATAVSAVKIGAADYLAKPADADAVYGALMADADARAALPENPMSADRVRWEHIQRVYELCNRNVSETARRLNMHRRTLQRILAKRAPR